MHAQATPDCRSQHQLNLRLLRYTASPQREEPVMLAQDLLAARRAMDALEVVETAMEREPDDADLLLTLGVALLESGEMEWARRVLVQAVQVEPEWSEPWRWLGETLLKTGDQSRAIRALERAKSLEGADPAVEKLLKSITRWDDVSRRLSRFLERPELVDPALLLQDLLDDGRIDEAERVLQIALAEDEEDPDLLLLRSRVERARGDLDAARVSLRRATELDPGWEEAWSDLESLLLEMGDEDAARQIAIAAKEAERAALEEALAERVAREKALAEQRAREERLRLEEKRAEEERAKAAAEEERQRREEAALEERQRREAAAEEERQRQIEESRKMQAVLARAAKEAEEAGKKAAKEALLRATADARAAAARRAAEERAKKEAAERAVREAEEREEARIAEEQRKKAEAFQRAWEEAEREARQRIAQMRAQKEEDDARRREEEAHLVKVQAEQEELAEGLRRAREAIWQQAKIEAVRRMRDSEAPCPKDVQTAAFARAREELEAEARREARAAAERRRREAEERKQAAEEARSRAEALERARAAARQQRLWEASSESRQAAASRALALAAKMAEDARERLSTTVASPDADEPVFELASLRTMAPTISATEVDEMLDDLLGTFEENGPGDTLPGMPIPGELDGGVGMRQSSVGLRLREDLAVPYQPAGPLHDTAVGIPAALETLH